MISPHPENSDRFKIIFHTGNRNNNWQNNLAKFISKFLSDIKTASVYEYVRHIIPGIFHSYH